MKTRSLTRFLTATLLAVTLGAVALVAQSGVAAAAVTTAEAQVEYGNANCGDTIMGAPVIGSARFVRSDNQLVLRYTMTAGDANTDYDVVVHDGDTCAPIGPAGSFTSNGAGRGRTQSKVLEVKGHDRFYAVATDTSNFVGITHGSLAVDLP